jgi:hypothetical protein
VLNKTNMDRLHEYDVRGKSIYANEYYARYGYSDVN